MKYVAFPVAAVPGSVGSILMMMMMMMILCYINVRSKASS